MNNSIISVCVSIDNNENVFLVKVSRKDKKFPLSKSVFLGCKLDDAPISDESKSQLLDLIYDTYNYSMLQREISLGNYNYQVISVLLDTIVKNLKLANNELNIYPPESTVLMYFIDITDQKNNLIKEVVSSIKNFNFSFLDILKFVGVKNIIIFLFFVQSFNFLITNKVVEFVEQRIGDSIIEIFSP